MVSCYLFLAVLGTVAMLLAGAHFVCDQDGVEVGIVLLR